MASTEPKDTKEAIKETLTKFEQTMADRGEKLTMAEYIKLLQLAQELTEEEPKEIKVEWVEAPKSTGA